MSQLGTKNPATLIALASPTTMLLAPMLLGAALAANPPLAPPPQLDATWSHGWDCVACGSNSMLSANFGVGAEFELDDPWWVKEVAGRYAQVLLSNFDEAARSSYNGTGEYPLVTLARALKKENPKIKTLLYQAADRGSLVAAGTAEIMAHPEWWLHDDLGNVVWFGGASNAGKHPVLDWTVPAVHEWFIRYPISLFGSPEEVRGRHPREAATLERPPPSRGRHPQCWEPL